MFGEVEDASTEEYKSGLRSMDCLFPGGVDLDTFSTRLVSDSAVGD